jgi:hypothetical protein
MEQRLVEGRDLMTSRAQGGRCAVCCAWATCREWQRELHSSAADTKRNGRKTVLGHTADAVPQNKNERS